MNDRQKRAFMDVAERFAELSYARKLKVGAIAVKDGRIISIGYNGTPEGWSNECEDVVGHDQDLNPVLKTKPEVLHAELNCIAKLARSTESGDGCSLFVTHGPCMECAKVIKQSGVREVLYRHEYRTTAGIDFLRLNNITVTKMD